MGNNRKLFLYPSQSWGESTPLILIERFASAYPGLWKFSGCDPVEFMQRRVVKTVILASYSCVVPINQGEMDDTDLVICNIVSGWFSELESEDG